MSSKSQQFAQKVIVAFENAGCFTDDEVKAAGGPSSSTMTKLRAAAERDADLASPRSDTFRNIDRAAQWQPGSARALWRHEIEPRASDGSDTESTVVEIPGDFRAWVENTDVLTDFQRRAVLRHMDQMSEAADSLRAVANKGDVEPFPGDDIE